MEAIWGFVGVIIGALASVLVTFLNGRNNLNVLKRTEEFKQKESAKKFQSENLIEIQKELSIMIRLLGNAKLEVMMFLESENEFHDFRFSNEVNQGIFTSNKKLLILTERISDDNLREHINEFRRGVGDFMVYPIKLDSESNFSQVLKIFKSLNSEIGVVLRDSYC